MIKYTIKLVGKTRQAKKAWPSCKPGRQENSVWPPVARKQFLPGTSA